MTDAHNAQDEHEDGEPLERQPDNASDAKSIRKKEIKGKLREREARDFWRAIFADPIGRREMYALLRDAHAFEERFACGPNGFPQTEATWFHAGEQAFGQRLYQSWFIRDPQGVMTMLAEHDPRFAAFKPPEQKN